jgi:hypothetical protein
MLDSCGIAGVAPGLLRERLGECSWRHLRANARSLELFPQLGSGLLRGAPWTAAGRDSIFVNELRASPQDSCGRLLIESPSTFP